MRKNDLNLSANFFWGIADGVLRDIYVHKYRDVILPMVAGLTGEYGKKHFG